MLRFASARSSLFAAWATGCLSPLTVFGALVAGILSVVLLSGGDASAPEYETSAPVMAYGYPAPDFTLPDADGDPLALSDLRGYYVLVNFWAWWCPPCIAEMPGLQQYYDDHYRDGFLVLGVHADADADAGRAFLLKNRITFPVVFDTDLSVYRLYSVGGLPQSFLINPMGNLIKSYPLGIVTREMLDQDLTPLLTPR